jgi:hypothetical protein
MGTSSKLKCTHCDFSCGRMKGLELHIISTHGFQSARDAYVSFHHNGNEPRCGCGCNEAVTWSWSKGFSRFRSGHNGNIDACYDADEARRIRELRSSSLTGRIGWALGLTKENSETIRKRAEASSVGIRKSFDEGRRSWNKGRRASNDQRIAEHARRARAAFASGKRVAWHKGKTKESSDGLRKMSTSISQRFSDRALRDRLTALKRLSSEEIIDRLRTYAPSLELVSNVQQYTRDRHNNLVFRCRSCGSANERSLLSALTNRCYICNPNGSKDQLEISKFVRSLGISHVISNRSEIAPYELDIWSSPAGIAIEYNGLYFHSECFKEKNYHSNKTALAAVRGIRLIHIFEDEWRDQREIVESMISHKFGVTNRSIAARKCEIRIIESAVRKKFFDATHMDGDAPARIAWGLFYKDELICCMSLRKPMNSKYTGAIEICRFSCALGTQVIGGLGKLTKAARSWANESGFTSIMTYVDTRHGDGKGYLKVGFNLIGQTPNRFWWTDDVNRYDRFVFRANSKAGLTEQQVAKMAGVKKIWGCPNLIMTLPT